MGDRKINIVRNFKKNQGFPDGIALDNQNGLWVAHWAGGQVSRINLRSFKIDHQSALQAVLNFLEAIQVSFDPNLIPYL